MELDKEFWRKASSSTAQADNCVEVAAILSSVAVRDSKDPSGPVLILSHEDFRRFTDALKNT
jgi:hypothetical protein